MITGEQKMYQLLDNLLQNTGPTNGLLHAWKDIIGLGDYALDKSTIDIDIKDTSRAT